MTKKRQPTLWAFEDGEAVIRPDGLTVHGAPSQDEWAALGPKLGKLRSGVQWAVGDWLVYGEERMFDENAYETAIEATGLKRGTLMNLKSVAKTFPKPARAHEVPWSHYALVAGFDDEQRGELLKRAQDEGLSWDQLRTLCRDARNKKAREWQQWPTGTFGVIVAQPPWHGAPFDVTVPGSMSADEISGLAPAIQGIAGPGCVCYLTATNYRLEEALDVLKTWGFTYRTNHVVMHELFGNGEWHRNRHHVVLVGTRGQAVPPGDDDLFDSLLMEGDELLMRLEQAFPQVPKVQLFARGDAREGWINWGERLDGLTSQTPTRAIRVRNDGEHQEVGA